MPRKRNPLPDDIDPDKLIQVTVRFRAEVVRELDLRADVLDCDRADVVRMETLKGLGWVERKRAQIEGQLADRRDAKSTAGSPRAVGRK